MNSAQISKLALGSVRIRNWKMATSFNGDRHKWQMDPHA